MPSTYTLPVSARYLLEDFRRFPGRAPPSGGGVMSRSFMRFVYRSRTLERSACGRPVS